MDGRLVFENVSKRYGSIQALDNVSFSVAEGEFFSILGTSGCGKTTLLRLVAGFEQPDSGRILLDGQDISRLPPHERPLNTVFQNYALFPHLSVWENIGFGLRVAKRPEQEIETEVNRMLGLIQMEEHAQKRPDELSGGQKQRVAIARALVNRPRLLLLDEPLSALDLKLRQKMLMEIDLIHDEVGITFLFVTHDQTEAMAVSDRIAVMHQGSLEQLGTPRELYETPETSFVAAFIGDTNFLDGSVQSLEEGCISVAVEGLPPILCPEKPGLSIGSEVHLSVRPEKILISREPPLIQGSINAFQGIVEDLVYKGDHSKAWIRVGEQRIAALQPHSHLFTERPLDWDDEVWVMWYPKDSYLLDTYHVEDTCLTELPPEKVGEDEEV